MTAQDELLEQVAPYLDYSYVWGWVIVFVTLGSLIVAFYWFSNLFDPNSYTEAYQMSKSMQKIATVRELDKIYLLTTAEKMGLKEATQRVSLALRTHFQHSLGIPAETMTLEDFKQAPPSHTTAPVIKVIEEIYPLIFSDNVEVENGEEFRRLLNKARYIIEYDMRTKGVR